MKKSILVLLLILGFLTASGGNVMAGKWRFDNNDVKGTWVYHSYYRDNNNTMGWDYGTVIFDNLGRITGGQGVSWQGYTSTITGGTYRINTDGTITATANVTTPGGNLTIVNVKATMNLSRDTITCLNLHSDGTDPDITILVKKP